MLILDDKTQAVYDGLKEAHMNKYGFPYLSPSAINDFKDCAEKFKLRREHRNVGLTSLAGSVMHELLDRVSKLILLWMKREKVTYDIAKKGVLSTQDFSKLYDEVVQELTKDVVANVITKELLTREKDYNFLKHEDKINTFFTGVKPIFAKVSFFDSMLDFPLLLSESPGYWSNNGHLFYGIIDRVGMKDGVLQIVDYKSIWGKASRSNWDKKKSTLQGWLYHKFVEDFVKLHRIKVDKIEVIFKFVEIDLPRDYEKIKYEDLQPEIFNKVMTFDDFAEERYLKDINTTCMLVMNDGGFIGDSKFGCTSCSYVEHCNHS